MKELADMVDTFGTKGGTTSEEWQLIDAAIKEYDVKNVLEFGSGWSTKKFDETVLRTVSLETDRNWAAIVRKNVPSAEIVVWDNKNMPDDIHGRFDMVFVDGKWPRMNQIKHGVLFAPRMFVHDANGTVLNWFFDDKLKLIHGGMSGWQKFGWQNVPRFTKGRLAFFERTS